MNPDRKPMAQIVDEYIVGHPGQSLDNLRSASLFSNLSAEELACFQDAAQTRSYTKGRILYFQGEIAEFFYIIYSGWIKLFHTMPEGGEIIVDMLTCGHMAGENAVFEQGRHMSGAQVIEDVQLIRIPSSLLKDRIGLSPTLALSMISSMSRHHRRRSGQIALNAMQNAPQRVGSFLLRLCPAGENKGVAFHLPYDKTLIASTLGMNGATFSRALNILRQKMGMRIRGRHVEIDSVELLMKFVYSGTALKCPPEKM